MKDKVILVGSIGHVDRGKTTLAAALMKLSQIAAVETKLEEVELRVACLPEEELTAMTKRVMQPFRARDAFNLKLPRPEHNRKARRADKRRHK